MVLVTTKLVSPVGKIGSVVSNGQSKTSAKVRSGNPIIALIRAPEIVNAVGKLVHLNTFSNVHVAGIMGNELS